MEFTSIKGFKDVLPEETCAWRYLEETARDVFRAWGFREIRTPLMERTELFSRSIGVDTDIVSKEMYTISDSRGRGMTLRPEATAGMIRAYVQHGLHQSRAVQKLFTIGPMFRHERPQKGRLRQFHQVDAEIIGDPGPRADADLIVMALVLLEKLQLDGLELQINSLGCPDCRPEFRARLQSYLSQRASALCGDCRRRAETNPLRVFDCKVPSCAREMRDAPAIGDFLCPQCGAHFDALQADLNAAGYAYTINPRLVRGLDYYNRTAFEIQTQQLGAQNAVVGGGRYDGLAKLIGGPDHPAIGFAMGMERVVALLEEKAIDQQKDLSAGLYIASLGQKACDEAFAWALQLRKAGCKVELDYSRLGLKAHMKRAHRLGAAWVLIVGDDELTSGKVILRDMLNGKQEQLPVDRVIEAVLEHEEGHK